MAYLNYYSKNYTAFNMTKEQIKRACIKNKGRICTRELTQEEYENKNAYALCSSSTLIYAMSKNHITSEDYKEIRIPKRSGGMRILHAPDDPLKGVQYQILKMIKPLRILPDDSVHSYTAQRNTLTALRRHQQNRSRWFLKLDLKDYFTSITAPAMIEALDKIAQFKYAPYKENFYLLLRKACFYKDRLPQGAVTSPFLSNLYLMEFDLRLKEYLPDGFCYTRYADDLLISSRESFKYAPIVTHIKELLAEYKVNLNFDKVRYGSSNGRNFNLGLMYNKDLAVTVGHHNKHVMKCMLHNLAKNKTANPEQYEQDRYKVQGILAYDKFIEPRYFANIENKFQTKQLFN